MIVLAPVGWLFGRAMQLRNVLYDRGILRSSDLGAKTISVGNITTGGTGKTPLVALIAEILADTGEVVCILTRGYGRKNENEQILVSDGRKIFVDAAAGGDEPVELARKMLGKAIVVTNADRVAAAKWAKERFNVTAFVLDDGFQHRRAKRDLDIVCVEATDPFGKHQLLLPGWLREPFKNIARADAIIISRSEFAENLSTIIENMTQYNPTAKIFISTTKLLPPRRLEHFLEERKEVIEEDIGRPFAFAGLANPELFPRTLEFAGYNLVGRQRYPDHVRYPQSEIEGLIDRARKHGATSLVTTAKDGVKLGHLKFSIPCFVIEVRTQIDKLDEFRRLITSS